MTVTMEQAVAFANNAHYFTSLSLPLKSAYKLNKIKKTVDKEMEFYGNKFQEILDTYAQKDDNGEYIMSEDGTQILIIDGKVEECNQTLEELQKMEIEVETYGLTIDELGDAECSSDQLDAIMPFIE